MAPTWVCNKPANTLPTAIGSRESSSVLLLWDGPKGLGTADTIQESLLSTKGVMVFTLCVYKHWPQALTAGAAGLWTLWSCHSWEKAIGRWGHSSDWQEQHTSTCWVLGGQWGNSTRQGPRQPWGTCKDEGNARQRKAKPGAAVRNLNFHTKLIHCLQMEIQSWIERLEWRGRV